KLSVPVPPNQVEHRGLLSDRGRDRPISAKTPIQGDEGAVLALEGGGGARAVADFGGELGRKPDGDLRRRALLVARHPGRYVERRDALQDLVHARRERRAAENPLPRLVVFRLLEPALRLPELVGHAPEEEQGQ